MLRKRMIVGLSLLLTGPVHAEDPAGSAGSPSVPQELVGLRERWESAMKDLDVPGLAVVVVRGGKVIYTETLGERDPEKHLPVTPDTIFYIASCTKSFMAMAVMSLVEEGKIELDAPVKKYFPKFQVADSAVTETLTVRDLLSHAKGLDSGPIVSLDAFTGEITEERFYRWLREAKATGAFNYTNLHYTLLGRIVEVVSGKSWKDYLDDRILKPAGMTRTTAYAGRMYGDADAAIPCDLEKGNLVAARVRKTDRTMHAAGGMGASIHDLGRWLRLNMGKGTIDGRRILSESSMLEIQRTQARATAPATRGSRTRDGYGFGWSTGTYGGKNMLEHGGGYVGAGALVAFLPDEGIGVAAVANTNRPITEIAIFDVCDRLLGLSRADELPRLKQFAAERRQRQSNRERLFEKRPVTSEGLSISIDRYAASYDNPDWGTYVIENRDGRLFAHWGDLSLRLRSTDKDTFEADSGSGDPDKCRFEVKGDRVEAVVIIVDEEQKLEARFTRK